MFEGSPNHFGMARSAADNMHADQGDRRALMAIFHPCGRVRLVIRGNVRSHRDVIARIGKSGNFDPGGFDLKHERLWIHEDLSV